jgi:hypothetical protein
MSEVLKGRIVDFGEDITVRVVDFGEDLCIVPVDFGEDVKIRIVDFGEQKTVRLVESVFHATLPSQTPARATGGSGCLVSVGAAVAVAAAVLAL